MTVGPPTLGHRAFSRGGCRCTMRVSGRLRRGRRRHARPARDSARLRPDRGRGSGRRAAARLPGLRDQEHDAGGGRRRDRRRGRRRAGDVSLAHARVQAEGGDPGRGARLAHRDRGLGARRAADPGADPVRRRRHDPGRDEGRAGRAAADGLQGGRRRAGHPRRDEGARRGLQDDRRRRRQPGRAGRGRGPAARGGRGAAVDRRDGRLLRAPRVRDAGRGLGGQGRRPAAVGRPDRRPAGDHGGAQDAQERQDLRARARRTPCRRR